MILNEYYDPEHLYKRDYIIKILQGAPRELKSYINKLPKIPCQNSRGEKSICTKIPEVIHVYLSGNY